MIGPCVDIVLVGAFQRLPWFDMGDSMRLVSSTGDRERGHTAPFVWWVTGPRNARARLRVG